MFGLFRVYLDPIKPAFLESRILISVYKSLLEEGRLLWLKVGVHGLRV